MRIETLSLGSRPIWMLLLLALAWSASPVAAQQKGFALDRFEPSERGSEWFALDTLDLRGHLRPAVGVIADYGYKPLVVYDARGHEVSTLVKHQLFLHAGASLMLWDRLRVALNLPLSPYVGGNDKLVSGSQYRVNTGPSIGDLRLSADVRLLGEYRSAASLAVGASLWLPTGSRDAYAGDGKVRFQPHALFAGELAKVAYAARAGFQYRGQNGNFAGAQIGNELVYGASVGYRFTENLLIGPEVYGSTVVQDGAFKKRGTPAEGILGGHYTFAEAWRIGAAIGTGFSRGFGSPELRVLGSLEWVPPFAKEERDRDKDGILDKDDACPDVPGVRNDDPAKNGCPPPSDRDEDTIVDVDDACPDEAGPANSDPTKNGCPLLDRDNDTIVNSDDACPDVPGPRNTDPAKNGCPAARIERGQIRIIDQVQFKTGSAEILPASDPVLTAVQKILQEHPEITKVSVEGHTDNVGKAAYNKQLSDKRVRSVVTWLTKHGIAAERLTSEGFGLERPIATNDTPEGRQQNRRVEFHIKGVDNNAIRDDGSPIPEQE